MSISAVFHNEDIRQQIFKYKKIECLLTVHPIIHYRNVLECNELIKFAYHDWTDDTEPFNPEDDFDKVDSRSFIKYLHCEHYLDDEMFCKGCGVGLICEYIKGWNNWCENPKIFRFEPEWYEPNEVGGNGGYMCKCCRREFGLN